MIPHQARAFQIPMRGNEVDDHMELPQQMNVFQIPMRGNEIGQAGEAIEVTPGFKSP